jgi:hypothetical protein
MTKEFMSFRGFLIELTKHSGNRFVGALVESNPLISFEFKSKDLHGVWAEYVVIVRGLLTDHSSNQNIFDETFEEPKTFIGRRIMQSWTESVRGQILTIKKINKCSDRNYFMVSGIDQDGNAYKLMIRKGQSIRTLKDKELMFQELDLGAKFHLHGQGDRRVYVKTSPTQYAEITKDSSSCVFSYRQEKLMEVKTDVN